MNEKLKKRNLYPLKIEGRGVEVSKTLFYVMKILQSKILSCIIKMFDQKFYRKILERV